jgi:sugar lactone lactonase YvrE
MTAPRLLSSSSVSASLRIARLALTFAGSLAVAACGDDGATEDASAASTGTPAGSGGGEAQGTGGEDPTATTTATTSGAGGDTPSSTGSAGDGGAGSTSTGGEGGSGGAGGAGGEEQRTFLDVYPLLAQYPEGGIYEPGDHAFYVGSLAEGSVHRIDAQTGEDETMFVEDAPGLWWTLGMAVDAPRRRLWVCAMEDRREFDEEVDYDGYVWLFDLDTGTREKVFALDDAFTDASCTDVAVTSDGTAYVTDRDFGNVYAIDAADDEATVFASDDELTGGVVGQNAIVVLPDESALLVAVYLSPRIVRVDLQDASVVDTEIEGDFFDTTALAGADGMTFHDGSVYVVFSSELVRVDPLLADWSSVETSEVDLPSGLTDVVSTPNGLYLLNGQAIGFAFGGEPEPFALTRFVGDL